MERKLQEAERKRVRERELASKLREEMKRATHLDEDDDVPRKWAPMTRQRRK
jgi:hypothetical protein